MLSPALGKIITPYLLLGDDGASPHGPYGLFYPNHRRAIMDVYDGAIHYTDLSRKVVLEIVAEKIRVLKPSFGSIR